MLGTKSKCIYYRIEICLIQFFSDTWNDRKSQAIRFVRSRDPKERSQAYQDYPELRELIPLITLVRNGFGTWKEVFELKEQLGMDKLMEIQNILSIIQQEEELDNGRRGH